MSKRNNKYTANHACKRLAITLALAFLTPAANAESNTNYEKTPTCSFFSKFFNCENNPIRSEHLQSPYSGDSFTTRYKPEFMLLLNQHYEEGANAQNALNFGINRSNRFDSVRRQFHSLRALTSPLDKNIKGTRVYMDFGSDSAAITWQVNY